jgi:hypothetical protein
MNQLDERERMRAAGIPGEIAFEWLCTPSETELVVSWCDRIARTLGASPEFGGDITHEGSWDDFEPRYCGPFDTASHVYPGDIVTPRAGHR